MGRNREISTEKRRQICLLKLRKFSLRKIATRLKISHSTVASTLKRFQQTGTILSKPRSGRPKFPRRTNRLNTQTLHHPNMEVLEHTLDCSSSAPPPGTTVIGPFICPDAPTPNTGDTSFNTNVGEIKVEPESPFEEPTEYSDISDEEDSDWKANASSLSDSSSSSSGKIKDRIKTRVVRGSSRMGKVPLHRKCESNVRSKSPDLVITSCASLHDSHNSVGSTVPSTISISASDLLASLRGNQNLLKTPQLNVPQTKLENMPILSSTGKPGVYFLLRRGQTDVQNVQQSQLVNSNSVLNLNGGATGQSCVSSSPLMLSALSNEYGTPALQSSASSGSVPGNPAGNQNITFKLPDNCPKIAPKPSSNVILLVGQPPSSLSGTGSTPSASGVNPLFFNTAQTNTTLNLKMPITRAPDASADIVAHVKAVERDRLKNIPTGPPKDLFNANDILSILTKQMLSIKAMVKTMKMARQETRRINVEIRQCRVAISGFKNIRKTRIKGLSIH